MCVYPVREGVRSQNRVRQGTSTYYDGRKVGPFKDGLETMGCFYDEERRRVSIRLDEKT